MTTVLTSRVLRQSGMGVTSFVLALVSLLSSILCLVVAGAISFSAIDGREGTPISYVLGGWIFGTGVLSLVGIVFGIGGLLQKERRKKLAAAGLVLNVVLPVGLMFILLMAMTLEPPQRVGQVRRHASRLKPDDAPVWKTPAARFFQFATAAMASAVVFVVQKKRRDRRDAPDMSVAAADTKALRPCPRCSKSLPVSAEFCRRCGQDMRHA